MADDNETGTEKEHRGRVQAQGGGTQEGVNWERSSPPRVTAVLEYVDQLEGKLKPKEKSDRAVPFADLRTFIRRAAAAGGVWANAGVVKKSFYKRRSADIRVDLDVFRGGACVPDDYNSDS